MATISRSLEWFFRGCLLVALVAVFFLALMPDQAVSLGSDKVNHIVAFVVLGALGQLAFHRLHLLAILFPLFVYGVLIEVIQYYLGRFAGLDDVLANLAGLAISAPLSFLLVHRD